MAFLDRFKTANYRDGSRWYERDGYFFIAYRNRNNKVYLRCAQTNCNARWLQDLAITSLNKLINEHNHPKTEWMRERNIFFNILKKRAGSETTPFPTIYAEEARRFPVGAKHLPYNMIDSSMRVARRQAVYDNKTVPVDSPREMHEISIFEGSTPKPKARSARKLKTKDFEKDESEYDEEVEKKLNENKSNVKACRGCLFPTRKLHKLGEASKKMFTTLTGLEMSEADGYPPFFCFECKNFIKKSLAFRRKCRRAFMIMQNVMTAKNVVTFDDIFTVNRIKTGLDNNLSYNKPRNTAFFTITDSTITQHKLTQSDGILCIDVTESIENYEPTNETNIKSELQESNETPKEIIDPDDVYNELDDKTEALMLERERNKECDRNMVVCTNETALLLSLASIKPLSEDRQREEWVKRQNSEWMKTSKFSCTMCITQYDTLELFNKHVDEHVLMSPSIYKCEICDCKFVSQAKLDTHTANLHLYEYQCKTCDSKLYTFDGYINHVKRKHPRLRKTPPSRLKLFNELEKEFTLEPMPSELIHKSTSFRQNNFEFLCKKCDIGFKNANGLQSHSKRHIEPVKKPSRCQCEVCKIWLRDTIELENHTRDWHMYTYKCNTCSEVLLNKAQALSHRKSHGGSSGRSSLSCEICNMTFSSEAGVVFHRYATHYAAIYNSHCVICGAAFSSQYSLYQHQIVTHGHVAVSNPLLGDARFYCKCCDVQFVDRAGYAAHVVNLNHAGEADKLGYACVPCKKMFDSVQEYETHSVTCSGCELQYPRNCCYCQERVMSKHRYNLHIRRFHDNLRIGEHPDYVLCEWCGKACHKLRVSHHRCTAGSSEVACSHCHAPLPDATQYVLHALSKHTGRAYACADCGLRFARRFECRDHIMKLHAPVRPYSCESCQREFSHIDYLNDHNKTVHESTTKKVRNNNKFRDRFITFPHMKIDVSLLDKEILDTVDLELSDYLESESKVVENRGDYFITTSSADSYKFEKVLGRGGRDTPEVMNLRRKRRLEGDKEKLGYKSKRRIKNTPSEVTEESETLLIEPITPDQIEEEVIIGEDMPEITMKLDETASEIIIDGTETLDVTERDGEKYVMIRDVLYKVGE